MTETAFSVQTQHDRITLNGGDSVELSYTVTNKTGATQRTGFDVKVEGDVQAAWFTLEEPVERTLAPDECINVTVSLKAPKKLAAGGGKFTLRAFDVDDPELRHSLGNWVDVGLAATTVGQPRWLKIALIAAGIVVVIGGGLWAFFALTGNDEKPVPEKVPLVADMSASAVKGLAPFEVTFTDNSTGNPTERTWSFGGAEPVKGEGATIKHRFDEPGDYVVRLTVSRGQTTEPSTGLAEDAKVVDAMESSGHTDTAEASAPSNDDIDATEVVITVLPRVHAEFVATPERIRAGMTVHFDNRSLGPIESWEWDFGNGKKSSKRFPDDELYDQPGIYDVSLVVRGADQDNVDTFKSKINVDERGKAGFAIKGARSGDLPLTVAFQNQSVAADTTLWDFGDGQTSTAGSPTHVYKRAGRFTVTLTITGASGTDKFSQPNAVIVTTPPGASLSASSSKIQRTGSVKFSYRTTGDVSSCVIELGDGARRTLRAGSGSLMHSYQSVGRFTAKMTVRGRSGKIVTSQRQVVVDPRSKRVVVRARQFGRLHPKKIRGDCDFKGHGPNIHARAQLSVSGRDLIASFYLQAAETKKDWSTARGSWRYPLYRAPTGWHIARITSPRVAPGKVWTDEWKFLSKGHGYHRRPGSYVQFTVRGDTGGNDICGSTADDTHMIVLVKNVAVEIVEDVKNVKRAAPASLRRTIGGPRRIR